MAAPNTSVGSSGPTFGDPAASVPGDRHLEAIEDNVRRLRSALGLAGRLAPENTPAATAHAPGDPARPKVSGPAFAVFHGTAILFIGVSAIYFGGLWALHPTARASWVGAVLALLGLIGVFYGARRLLRLLHSPPIVSDSDTPAH